MKNQHGETIGSGKWEREHRAFLSLLPELLQTHRGQYVAIHNGRVEDTDADELALAERVLTRLGGQEIHVGLVAETQPVARLTHYSMVWTKEDLRDFAGASIEHASLTMPWETPGPNEEGGQCDKGTT